jgi:16S rRNA (cytosine967-C5)-methyltransferase
LTPARPAPKASGPPGVAARSLAIDALVRVESGGYSNLVLPGLLRSSGLDGRDRAFVTELVYDTLRSQGRADFLLRDASRRPVPELDAPVRAALRLGVAQLLSGTPPHAAVGETVGALGRWKSPSAAGATSYANAVLRKVAALAPDWPWPAGDAPAAIAVRTSHPVWLVDLLHRGLGREAEAVLEFANTPPAVTLRPNPRRTTPEALATELTAVGATVEAGRLVPTALLIRSAGDLSRLPAISEGRASPQDQASQAVAAAVAAQPGEHVLDMAAAPGGKSTAMAEAMNDEGLVVAVDLNPGRAARITAAAQRLGLSSVSVLAADARHFPLRDPEGPPAAARGPARFDRVLLDAPCSGLGVLRRRPEARWRLDPSDIDRLAILQRELLNAAVARLRPGGLLAYSVCTFTREETLDIDAWLAATFPKLTAEPPPGPPWHPHGRGALLLPTAAGTDGMFLLLLRSPGYTSEASE